MHFELELRKRHAALFVGSIAALVAVVTLPQLLGHRVAEGVEGLGAASAGWLWLAGFAFGASLLASASGWASALTRCGGTTTRADAAARYCTGSLVNAVAPARLGSAIRFALFSRVLPNEGRIWTTGGVATSLGAIRLLWLALVLALGSAFGQLPRWPIALLLLGVAVAALVAWRARNSRPGTRFAHALDAFRVLGRCPRAAAQIAGWIGLGMGLRIVAATGIAAAFGVDRPLAAALLIIPALDLAGLMPITPGNVGVASAAVAFALTTHGTGSDLALTAGIAFGVVETLTTLVLGCGSLLYFAGCRTDARRWRTAAVSFAGCLAIGAAFGATVLVPLV
ncbi:MAG TPA: lysylphosphatidylglycerol synthase domain-containing protein [Gaiellaceae bacterium]|nr:lysylphosphatidylglycerol synthase domain-containing protein [Gaiellaceae bacterium]